MDYQDFNRARHRLELRLIEQGVRNPYATHLEISRELFDALRSSVPAMADIENGPDSVRVTRQRIEAVFHDTPGFAQLQNRNCDPWEVEDLTEEKSDE